MPHNRREGMGRRAFLARLGATGVAASAGLWDPVRAAAQARAQLAAVIDPTGTTLELSIRRPAGPGYRRLVEAAPYPQVVREELADAGAGREDRRRPLASIVHLTDVHVVDVQSPARVEFTDRLDATFDSAHRPQEALSVQVASSMVERISALGRGPVTGRRFDVAVSTGDNIDNQQQNELDWFITVYDGGSVTPNSGDPDVFEGIQDATLGLGYYNNYWHPDPPPGTNPPDSYKVLAGFPELPGLLSTAIQRFDAPGLEVPWYSTYGNHDGLRQGTAPGELPAGVRPFDVVATGSIKVTSPATSFDPADLAGAVGALPGLVSDPLVVGNLGLVRIVTPDAARATATLEHWVQRHLDSPATPGPVGHGYTAEMIASRRLYYSFEISEALMGISLDTVNHGGYSDGSIGDAQLAWLEQELIRFHGAYFDRAGTRTTNGGADRVVVLFSHHNLFTMENPVPDPFAPTDPRRGFAALRELLSRFPNVVAWVNGHSHVNRITPVPDTSGRTGGFWEISTAAHIDWPEQARLVEVTDNCDGTLSIFGTLIEHASPATVELADLGAATPGQLASISRELAANDPQSSGRRLGAAGDRNVELLIKAPFGACAPTATPPTLTGEATGGGRQLPATGGGGTVAGGALAVAAAAAVALRRRAQSTAPPSDR